MLNSKQRARLASLAATLDPVVRLGKAGADDGVAATLDKALADHELVKLRFVDFKDDRKELSRALAERCAAELVRVIGNVAVFYRQSPDPDKRTIALD
ncbi:MAG TPA: YhbY family RNA-binding protein [Spirochaetales bacterium]|nr:YhbY family RNA-binding protein [Spirochaetales bacterium]MBP7264343.1 YhbY family RNA-binding protein [Spirochaetia bacterium]HPE35807.1 YhbY family RNA-binding protein [Spirochaetales bacterium]